MAVTALIFNSSLCNQRIVINLMKIIRILKNIGLLTKFIKHFYTGYFKR
jgi:hypothetical protein